MLAQTMGRTGIVFSKTDKGREEMTKRAYGLGPLQRRVLILIDGSKDLETLAEMIPALAAGGQLQEILEHLLQHDFIASIDSDAGSRTYPGKQSDVVNPADVPPAAAAPTDPADLPQSPSVAAAGAGAGTALTEDPATIRMVKDFMTTTAQTYLGLLSAPVIQRIEQARTAAQLMTVAGHWNMALRDSQQGKRFASPYLEQVKSALVAGAQPVLGDAASAN